VWPTSFEGVGSADRGHYKAGESIADLADDHGEDPLNIEEAVRCELQPAKAA
jgi:hypothetical protein